MLSNLHTHTTYCDGADTPEKIVLSAIEKGFCSIGFSGHSYTEFDTSYCMTDINGYIKEINDLKEKYKDKIQVYLGVEEDMYGRVDRKYFDYIIGSSHYLYKDGRYYPVDESLEDTKKCYKVCNNDLSLFAESYFSAFTDYILQRKPEIIGHFDILTKYDETEETLLLNNKEYLKIAKRYLNKVIDCGSLFEVNTRAVSSELRTEPYPCKELLYEICKGKGKIILSSDCHCLDDLDSHFDETKVYLKDIGFKNVNILYDGKFTQIPL